MKKFMSIMGIIMLVTMLTLSGCSSSNDKTEEDSKNANEVSKNTDEKVYKVGILQFAQHGSLDNCRTGVIEGLKEAGFEEGKNLEIDYQNAQADMGINSQIADSFVKKKYDMIITIATPSAMAAYNAALDTDIPVIYTAVTDPVEAQLATEDGKSVGNITGTSDILPVDAQLKLMRKMLPNAKKVGILHTSSEANSDSMIETYKEIAPKYDFEIVDEKVNQTSDIPLATDSILTKVDVMTNLLDNTVVNSLPQILDKANEKKIPIYGSEIEQVRIGCIGSEGIEYISLGNQTGKMAAKVLKGESKAGEMPYETILKPNLYLNKKVCENLGVNLDKELTDRATELFEEISEPEAK